LLFVCAYLALAIVQAVNITSKEHVHVWEYFQRLVPTLMRNSYLTRYIVLRLNLETTKAKLNAVTRPQRVLPKLTKFYIANVWAAGVE
jgi:hypothetical protein